jgi:hypothetical protein
MRTQLRRAVIGAIVLSLTVAGSAAAHDHQVCTPGAGDPLIGAEPFHGQDPSGGAILNNPNVSPVQYAAWGMHPIHHFLHFGRSADTRAITVIRIGTTASCP